jgi:CO/xanthine dehydrogenase Mo-binding subunit
MGQGLETTLAQVCADVLRVPLDHIVVRHGDTALMPTGVGTYASRAAVMAGSAVHYASLKLRDKILRLAAAHLESNPADLVLDEGSVSVVGVRGRGCTLKELAALAGPAQGAHGSSTNMAPDVEALEATHHHRTSHETSAFTVHLAIVALDLCTGQVIPLRYLVATDVGRAINPMIVEGQLAGGALHGIGGALLEELVYDESGQLRTASFMDYLVPGSVDSPSIDVLVLQDAPAASNPLGLKGVGEAGTSGAGAAIANAVANALGRDVEVTQLPLTPERVLKLLVGPSE